MIGDKTKILLLLLLCHLILVKCHTIILDNGKSHERKSCSKVTCSKYLSPSFDDDHHWPSSFFKRRKDPSGDKTSLLELSDTDSTAESVAKFSTTDIQDIESLNSEMESLERRTGNRNDAAYYSGGSDVRKFEMKKRRKRRGSYNDDQEKDEGGEIIDVNRSGNTTGFNGRRKRGDESRHLIDDSTSFSSVSVSSSPINSSSSSFSWKEEKRTKRETTRKWVRRRRGARDQSEESKQRAKRRRMECCQRWKKEEQERTGEGESDNVKRHEEGENTSPNPFEFHHRFGYFHPFQASTAMQVHHTSFPPYLLPPSSSHFHSPHPSIPPFLPPPHPFLPNTASFGSEQPNALHFNLLGPSIPSLGREMFNHFNVLPSTPSLSMGFNQNANGQMFRPPFPLMSPNPLLVPNPSQSESKSDSEEEKSQPSESRTGESTFVDEEEEERRRIDHELERKRQIMIMSGQYQPYEPWIHGPILPAF